MGTNGYAHRKSILPSLLEAYLPPQQSKQSDQKQESKQRSGSEPDKYRKATISDEDEDDLDVKAKKRTLQEKHHLEVYRNVYRLRNAMRAHYMELLNNKVQQQRLEIKQQDLKYQRSIEEREKKQTAIRRSDGQQSTCSQLCHDMKYLKSIPKSRYYMIVELQNQLAKNGTLKNRRDYEDFWHLIKQQSCASQFEMKLEDVKLKMTSCRSLPFKITLVQNPAKNPWITKAKDRHLPTGGLPGLPASQCINHLESKQKKVRGGIEQMFPELVAHHPFSFQVILNKQIKAQTVKKDLEKMQQKISAREMRRNQLHQMYSLSFTNRVTAQRLLERNDEFKKFEEASVQDLISYWFPETGKVSQSQKATEGSSPANTDIQLNEQERPMSLERTEKTETSSERKTVGSSSQEFGQQSQNGTDSSLENLGIPLSMEDVLLNCRVVEAKQASSLWINYANLRECDHNEEDKTDLYEHNVFLG